MSSDHTPPNSYIQNPNDGAWLVLGKDRRIFMVLVAEDEGGGCVAAVEGIASKDCISYIPMHTFVYIYE